MNFNGTSEKSIFLFLFFCRYSPILGLSASIHCSRTFNDCLLLFSFIVYFLISTFFCPDKLMKIYFVIKKTIRIYNFSKTVGIVSSVKELNFSVTRE